MTGMWHLLFSLFFKIHDSVLFIWVWGDVVWVCVLQETGGVGGGQQPDRGDLPDPAATANHLFPAAPSLADQRLCQPGMETRLTAQILLYNYCSLSVYVCVLTGDGCGWSLQRGRWATSSPPQPLPFPPAALQHSSGPTGRPADPGRPQLNSPDSSLDIQPSATI